jgi:energy-coupling factor transporter ATP-binding protein EcfA2
MSKSKRYPGPKPFSADQAHLFYGRKPEAHRLRRLIEDKQLTVLYGRSGYGKSSLLNAAVLPKMEEQGYHLINVRLGAWTPESTNTPLRSTVQAIAENPANLDKTILDDLVNWDNSLWYYTKTFSINTKRPKLLFVFDQFEELFTYPKKEIELYENSLAELLKTSLPQRYRDQLKEKKELEGHPQRDAVFQRLEIKIVIGIRSNRFHLLERLSPALPDILQNTLELDALQREGARSAIVSPAAETQGDYDTPPFSYAPEIQEEILDFLTQEGKIEGILLQMLCSYFERLIIKNPQKRSIEASDLMVSTTRNDEFGNGMEEIVDIYYRDRIDDLPDEQEETVKRFIEDNLVQKVGDGGMRLSMHQAQIKERFGIEAVTLNELVFNGLLRTEPFLRGGVTYELTHDRLITPVLKSKAVFDAGEADRLKLKLEEEERKRKIAEGLQRKAEAAEEEANKAKKIADQARTKAEEQRKQALEAKRVAERNELKARRLAWISGVLMLLATATGIWAVVSLQTAKSERAEKNLILCKELLVDARRLIKANYCDSAEENLAKAEYLIVEYGTDGSENISQAYTNEKGILEKLTTLVKTKKKQGQCN